MQGDALMQEITGAQFMAMAADIPLLRRMRPETPLRLRESEPRLTLR